MDEGERASGNIGKVDKQKDGRAEEERRGWRLERRNEKRRREIGRREGRWEGWVLETGRGRGAVE